MDLAPTACSAPGKVLLAGGYLILDRAHTGIVFGLDARIHVHVQQLPTSSGVSIQEIIVKSPQFPGATWRYGYTVSTNEERGGVTVTQLTSGPTVAAPRNPFIETALAYALSYIVAVSQSSDIQPSVVTILADDDYYSSPSSHRLGLSGTGKQFKSFSEPLWKANKTGLGSSAALVTSFTAALLSHYLPTKTLDLKTDDGRQKLHNLAQASHCAAQGKVGSGFDVASAVFGSSVYRRFSPSVLEQVGELGSTGFAERLKECVDNSDGQWDVAVAKDAVAIPKGLKLIMCDVDCGSQTPGMVKQVLQWRKDNPESANKLWSDLQAKNDQLAQDLLEVKPGSYQKLRQTIEEARTLIRDMSEQSKVPIEPPAQTRLLDACSEVTGVIGGVVPGAGGFDAIALLIEDSEDATTELERLLHSWKFEGSGSSSGSGKVKLMKTKGEMEGVRVEDAAMYKSWTT